MTKDGSIVSIGFLLVIIICYGYYTYSAIEENERLRGIATKQKEIIEEIQIENKELQELIEAMFLYIDSRTPPSQRDPGLYIPKRNHISPWDDDSPVNPPI